jgi:hypothetical protein
LSSQQKIQSNAARYLTLMLLISLDDLEGEESAGIQ